MYRGFTLLEMMLVVVIIALIAAIAIPKFSRGAAGANDSAVAANLAVLRNAVDMFQAEHGNAYPAIATFTAQLTQFTDASGAASATKDATHIYGPYLRSIPALPVGAAKGSSGVAAAAGTGVGWIFNVTTGAIQTNTTATEVDSAGNAYTTY
jgi:general secretion pathway protein G